MDNGLTFILNKLKKYFSIFNDKTVRYSINFKTSTLNNDLKFYATDIQNSSQYVCNLSDKNFSTFQNQTAQRTTTVKTFAEFLENLHKILVKREYSLKKDRDLVKFETNNKSLPQVTIFLSLNENYREVDYLKETCLNLYEKLSSLEDRNDSTEEFGEKNRVFSNDFKNEKSSISSLTQKQSAINVKAGMSIINPNSKKRKAPKGVQFEDEEGEENY